MTTLDGVERELTRADLLICDAERVAQGIAGIMGGAAAEVSGATTSILLESAYFEASGIAKTSKRLGLRSEASARFERGVDPNDVAAGAARAMELLVHVADAQPRPGADRRVPAADRASARHGSHRTDQPDPRARARRHRDRGLALAARHRSRGRNGDRADLAPRRRARDRRRRGDRASGRAAPHRALGPVEPGEDRRAQRPATRSTAGRRRTDRCRLRRGVHAAAARARGPRAMPVSTPTR